MYGYQLSSLGTPRSHMPPLSHTHLCVYLCACAGSSCITPLSRGHLSSAHVGRVLTLAHGTVALLVSIVSYFAWLAPYPLNSTMVPTGLIIVPTADRQRTRRSIYTGARPLRARSLEEGSGRPALRHQTEGARGCSERSEQSRSHEAVDGPPSCHQKQKQKVEEGEKGEKGEEGKEGEEESTRANGRVGHEGGAQQLTRERCTGTTRASRPTTESSKTSRRRLADAPPLT
jgi:hypothetical protein